MADAELSARPPLARLMRSPLGRLIARPWLDEMSLSLLKDWYLPMSRAWAAASISKGDFSTFCRLVEVSENRVFDRLIREFQLGRVADQAMEADRANAAWEKAWFNSTLAVTELIAAEKSRLDAEQTQMLARLGFAIFARAHRLPAAKFEVPDPDQTLAAYGSAASDPVAAFMPPADARIEHSRTVPSRLTESVEGEESFIRFAHANRPDDKPAWGHIFDPAPSENAPTVLLLHGLMMEMDQSRMPRDEVARLNQRGIRVIALEGPWHGRRRPDGYYGGEMLVSSSPIGAYHYFRAHMAELALVTEWLRRNGTERVGWMGTSMGAFTAMLAAGYAVDWPNSRRPDALFLVTPSQGFRDIAVSGAFARAFGIDNALNAAGWEPGQVDRLSPLFDPPRGDPGLPRDAITMLIGEHDTVAPAKGALAMAKQWGLAEDQVIMRPQGHFSTPAGLMIDEGPLLSFAEQLSA